MLRAVTATALILLAGCTRIETIGGPVCSEPSGCDAGMDSGLLLPIGDASYPDFDVKAYQHMATTMTGTWYGLVWALEKFGPPFELRFEPAQGDTGHGKFVIRCLENTPCAPFGYWATPEQGTGDYDLTYVDSQQVGEGELSWTNRITQTMRFRNALLQGGDQIFSFYMDFVAGTVQVVMTRDAPRLPDAGTPADAGDQARGSAREQSTDAGISEAGP